MPTLLAWLGVALGALIGMAAAMTLVGACLPHQHVASRTRTVAAGPVAVWAAVADFPGQTTWRRDLLAVERRPDSGGDEVWRERSGRHALTFRTAEASPPGRLVRAIDDEHGPFRGRWEFAIEPGPAEGQSRVALTEVGEVANPFFRFINRFVIGQATTLEGYLADLDRKLAGR